jgi:MBG domain (YGX type)/Abnormal spindle-like microcephaly-assoc'd, ASPM-SPD-2-Hydin/Beta-propeller repeat
MRSHEYSRVSLFLFAVLLAGTTPLSAAQELQPLLRPGATSSAIKPPAAKWRVSEPAQALRFELNQGQDSSNALYVARGDGYSVALEKSGARFRFAGQGPTKLLGTIRLSFPGAQANVVVTGESPLPGESNFIPTGDRATWRLGIPGYARVVYKSIYAGTDLAFYGNGERLEYDFSVRPRADVNLIHFAVQGADRLRIDAEGDLAATVDGKEIHFLKPVAYQIDTKGNRRVVEAGYRLLKRKGGIADVRFALSGYNPAFPLVIDPVITYSTLIGPPSTGGPFVDAITTDSSNNIYLAGELGGGGFYIEKLASNGQTFIYGTTVAYGTDYPFQVGSIAVSSSGSVYVSGTAFPGLPTNSESYLQTAPNSGDSNAFLAVFNSSGVLSYTTYLNGPGSLDESYAFAVAVDSSGNAYVGGYTSATDFPTTTGAYQTSYPSGAGDSAFVAKFNPSASGAASLLYSTFLGASDIYSYVYGIALDSSDDAYLAFDTSVGEQHFPTTNGAVQYDGEYPNFAQAYVAGLNSSGSGLVYAADLGPGQAYGIALDGSNDAYVTGAVLENDFPTTSGAYQVTYPGGFVSELNPTGTAIVYSTFLSGPSAGLQFGFSTVDPSRIALPSGCSSSCDAYVTGTTTASDFPLVNQVQDYISGGTSAFVVELNGAGTQALFSSYFAGGSYASIDESTASEYLDPGIAVDTSGNIDLAGNVSPYVGTNYSQFPINEPLPATTYEGFLAQISPTAASNLYAAPTSITFSSQQVVGVSTVQSEMGTNTTQPTVMLENLGSVPVTLQPIEVSPASDFSETDNCNGALAAGASCILTLNFTPTSTANPITGTVTVTPTSGATPVVVPLSGSGLADGFLQTSCNGATPCTSIAFPDTAVGSFSPVTVTLTNIGSQAINYFLFSTEGQYAIVSNCPQSSGAPSLAVGASCQAQVEFVPTNTGNLNGEFNINASGSLNGGGVDLSGTGIPAAGDSGTAFLDENSLNFGNEPVGASNANSIVVEVVNSGTTPVTVFSSTVSTSGDAAGVNDFQLSGCGVTGNSVIAVGGYCNISVLFLPTQSGTRTGTMSVLTSASPTPLTASLMGIGSTGQMIQITPADTQFPNQVVGTTSNVQDFWAFNTGTSPFIVDRVTATGDFQLTADGCAQVTLQPSTGSGNDYSYCEVEVEFLPTSLGALTGTLSFYDAETGEPQTFGLSGTGIAATGTLQVDQDALVFATQAIGTSSSTQQLQLTNPGNSTVTISSIAATGDYSFTSSCGAPPATLAPGRSCYLYVSFNPSTGAPTPDTGTLSVSSSAGMQTVMLSGTPVAESQTIAVIPSTASSFSFGSVVTGTSTGYKALYVVNTGTATVTFSAAPSISGTNEGDFTLSNGCGGASSTLAPNAYCRLQISFEPSTGTTESATLTLSDNASNGSGTQTLALSGTGVSALPTVTFSPQTFSFTPQVAGSTSSQQEIVIYNNSSTSLAISSVTLSPSSNFILTSQNCTTASVAAGSNCTAEVEAAPLSSNTGPLATSLQVVAGGTTYTANLAGYALSIGDSGYLSPAELNFPGQPVGSTSTSQTFDLYNSGTEPFTIGTATGNNVTVGGTTGIFYASTTCTSGQVVQPGSDCSMAVYFNPASSTSTSAPQTGTITIPVTYGDGTTGGFTENVSGSAVADQDAVVISPTNYTFPNEGVNATPANGGDLVQDFVLTNNSNLPIKIGQATAVNTITSTSPTGQFTDASGNGLGTFDNCSNLTALAAGSTCTIAVAFVPTTVAQQSGSLTLPVTFADGTTTTAAAVYKGDAVAASSSLVITPAAFAYSPEVQGETQASIETDLEAFSVTNNGNQPVSFTASSVSSPTGTNFTLYNDTCGVDYTSSSPLPSGRNCTVIVQFAPAASSSGAITGTLTINDNTVAGGHAVPLSGTALPLSQQIAVSQTTINFANQNAGSESPVQYFYVLNQGATSIAGTSIALGGADPSQFILQNNCNTTLSGHSACSLSVYFDPGATVTGSQTATVTLTYILPGASSASNIVITLNGTAVTPGPNAAVFPTTLAFGSQATNTTSATQYVGVTNTGSLALAISSVVISTNPTDFKIASNNCPASLAVNASCEIGVNFAPSTGGALSGALSVTDNSGGVANTTQAVSLAGTGTGTPEAALTPPSPYSFGNVNLGQSASEAFTLTNGGTGTLSISGVAVSGANAADFIATNGCGSSLAASSNCTITVKFTPSSPASNESATLTVTDNANGVTGSPQTELLSGTGAGVPQAVLSPAPYNFSNVDTGTTANESFTLANNGTATLAISSGGISIVPGAGTGASIFTITSNGCGSSVAMNASCTINVSFAPAAATSYSATLQVVDNSGNVTGTTQTSALSGTGVGTPIASLTASVPFGNVNEGSKQTATATISNTGLASLTVSAIAILPGTNSADFTITSTTCGSLPATVAASSSCLVNLSFAPSTGAAESATLQVTDNSGLVTGSTQTSSLTGTGVPIPIVSLSQSSYSFPAINEGASETSPTFTISNTGTASLNPLAVTIMGTNAGDFTFASDTCSSSLANGSSCAVSVTFKPTAVPAGAESAYINIADNAANSPQTISLTGTGQVVTTTLTLNPVQTLPVTYGTALSVVATVSGPAGDPTPAGNVSYQVDGGPASTAALSSGSATLNLGVLAASSHTLSVTYAANGIYSTVTQTLAITVNKAPLTITASNVSVPYDQPIPALTGYTATGFVNGDTSAVLSGAPAESTTATQGSSAGTYPIVISVGTLAAANYSFAFVNGTLTISGGLSQTITFNALPNVTYGVAPITLAATASSGLAVTYSVTGPAMVSGSTLAITGAGTVSVTASQAGNADYNAAISVTRSFAVNKAPLTITASNVSVAYDQPIPPLTGDTATGFVNGDTSAVLSGTPAESTTATQGSSAGTYPIVISVGTLAAANYSFTFVNGTLTIIGPLATSLQYTGPTAFTDGSSATLSAVLTQTKAGSPIAGVLVTLTLGSASSGLSPFPTPTPNPPQTCSADTNASGLATCSIAVVDQPTGSDTVFATFAGNSTYLPSFAGPVAVTIAPAPVATTLTYTGPTAFIDGSTARLSAVLLQTENHHPIFGATIVFTLGTGVHAESCTATTNNSGVANCSIPRVDQAIGNTTISASFAGNTADLPSNTETIAVRIE